MAICEINTTIFDTREPNQKYVNFQELAPATAIHSLAGVGTLTINTHRKSVKISPDSPSGITDFSLVFTEPDTGAQVHHSYTLGEKGQVISANHPDNQTQIRPPTHLLPIPAEFDFAGLANFSLNLSSPIGYINLVINQTT